MNAAFGFVYEIRDRMTDKRYVGMKQTHLKRKKQWVPSKWQAYWGSCTELLIDLKVYGKSRFERRILALYDNAPDLRYAEVEAQVVRDVLRARLPDGSRAYYNNSVAGRWYAHHFEARAKLRGLIPAHQKPSDLAS